MASMRLTFVGTGVSCAVPVIGHVDLERRHAETDPPACCCTDAVLNPAGPNRRNNASLLISLLTSSAPSAPASHILIDAGKTFRDAYFRVLAPLQVPIMDVLLLTHGHADAMHCVEEVCAWQTEARRQLAGRACEESPPPSLPTFLTRKTLDEVASISPDLVARSHWVTHDTPPFPPAREGDAPAADPTTLAMHELHEDVIERLRLDPFLSALTADPQVPRATVASPSTVAPGSCKSEEDVFPIFSVPVEHGRGYISMAFVFGYGIAFRSLGATRASVDGKTCVVYISDVSDIPELSMRFLQDLVKIDVLVFDLLAEKSSHSPSHTCWDDIMPFIRALTPRKTYFVGMFCSLEHNAANAEWVRDLEAEKCKVRASLTATTTAVASETETTAQDRQRMEEFLECVESLELAFDGQQLVLPL